MSAHAYEANRVRVAFKNHELRLASNVVINTDVAPEPESGIGNIIALEYVPTFYRVSVTLSGVLERNQALVDDGIIPEDGVGHLNAVEFDIEVFDKQTGSLLQRVERAKNASSGITVTKHALTMLNATFVGIDTGGSLQ